MKGNNTHLLSSLTPAKPFTGSHASLGSLQAKPDGDMLFWAGCKVAETMADTGKPKPSVAMDLLVAAVNPVIKRDEARRVITNAFNYVEKQILSEGELDAR